MSTQRTPDDTQKSITREARTKALAMARTYPIIKTDPYSLRGIYWSLAQGLRALEYGTDDPADAEAFICYQTLDFDEDLQRHFKAAWGRDIGRAAGLISSLATDRHSPGSPSEAVLAQESRLASEGGREMRTVHSAVYLPGLRSGILGGAFSPGVIEQDGVEARDKAQAVRWIDQLLRKGREYSSGCPTPQPDGQCPGHEKGA